MTCTITIPYKQLRLKRFILIDRAFKLAKQKLGDNIEVLSSHINDDKLTIVFSEKQL